MELKTPLYEKHLEYGGKMVPFGGYILPVQYKDSGVIKEHMAVRTAAGMFDVSHMGEIICEGPDALANLQMLLTNDFTNMVDEQARYSPMCNEKGGTVDDLIVYKMNDNKYFLVVNAANKDKDYKWMCDHQFGDVTFTDVSDQYAQIAVQGPKAKDIISKICKPGSIPEKYYYSVMGAEVAGIPCICSTTGYTGEDGVELYLPAAKAPEMWDAIYEAGKDDGLIPCGLGARDTLRMEAGMPLYGHEMDDDISPREAGLMFAIKLKKEEDFIGKKPMVEAGKPAVVRVGLKITGRGIAREHQDIYVGDEKIGYTTSGTKGPYFDYPIAMARVPREYKEIGTKVEIDVRGRRVEAEVIELPFYKR